MSNCDSASLSGVSLGCAWGTTFTSGTVSVFGWHVPCCLAVRSGLFGVTLLALCAVVTGCGCGGGGDGGRDSKHIGGQ